MKEDILFCLLILLIWLILQVSPVRLWWGGRVPLIKPVIPDGSGKLTLILMIFLPAKGKQAIDSRQYSAPASELWPARMSTPTRLIKQMSLQVQYLYEFLTL